MSSHEQNGLIDFHNSLVHDNKFLTRVGRTIRRKKIKCISLDIFDTCVLRAGLPEIERFIKTAEIIKSKFSLSESVNSIARKRLYSHTLQYGPIMASSRDSSEPTDLDIYKHLITLIPEFSSANMSSSESISVANNMADCEVEMEISNSIFSPFIMKILDILNPDKIIFVSDMYLSSARIKNIVDSLSQDFPSIDISDFYISNEMGASKSEGSLFRKVVQTSGLSASNTLHIGDNKKSDVHRAEENGIFAMHLSLPVGEITRRRKRFLEISQTLNLSSKSFPITL